jgi:hypothetical protein
VVIDSSRIGSDDALTFHEIPEVVDDVVKDGVVKDGVVKDKKTFIYDNAVNALFQHRAEVILETYYSTLTKKAREELKKIYI